MAACARLFFEPVESAAELAGISEFRQRVPSWLIHVGSKRLTGNELFIVDNSGHCVVQEVTTDDIVRTALLYWDCMYYDGNVRIGNPRKPAGVGLGARGRLRSHWGA